MAAKLLHTLAEDNGDLQKQIGCMNGIFQIFDRHHVLTGRRTAHRRLALGNANVNGMNFEGNSVEAFNHRRSVESNHQRLSTESSRLSFSSSCSSSPSSSEFNKGAPPAFDRLVFPESPIGEPTMNEGNGFQHMGLDLRDVVRDSMYREARGLPMVTSTTRNDVGRRGKTEDMPRPGSLPKSVTVDLNESLRVLAKLRETPQLYNNGDGKKDAPRCSFDSRESRQKVKEMPRLSLDSRERVMRNSAPVPEISSSGSSGNNKVLSLKRPPSVVAKLMGLEAMPGSPLGRDGYPFSPKKTDFFDEKNLSRPIRLSPSSPRSSGKDPGSPRWRNTDFVMKPISNSRFPIEPAPWRTVERNRVSQKQAPVAARLAKVPSRVSNANSSPSVYSEMEKRLNDLEFNHSGKDLRALKQILEAMQSKGFLDMQKQGSSSNFGAQREYETANSADSNQNPRLMRNSVTSSSNRRGSSSSSSIEVFESPIVIMKPAKLVEKAGIPASALIPIHSLSGLSKIHRERPQENRRTKARSPGTLRGDSSASGVNKKPVGKNVRSSSEKSQQISKESISKSSGSVSPRLQQQKKLGLEKSSRPPTPPSDSVRSRRKSNRELTESTSPGGKRRPKSSKSARQNDDQLSTASNESRTSSHPGDDMCTQLEAEVASIEKEIEINDGKTSSAIEAAKTVVSNLMQNKSSPRFGDDSSATNVSGAALEHPSPIVVLDASIYREISSSPVKTQDPKGNGACSSSDEHCGDQWNPAYSFSETTSGFSPEINRKKLQNVEHLVQKLRRLNSTHDEASQDYIASLCENTNPNTDHRYISEILLASGLLLRDLGSGLTAFQLHPSGHPINPELFLVLEQTKAGNSALLLHEKLHRRIVFDAVNEILVEKLAFDEAIIDPWMKSGNMGKRAVSAQQLLKELCSEIEALQKQARKRSENLVSEEEDDLLKGILCEDVIMRSGNWTDFNREIAGLVLDVERLLFKDLVDEVVRGEAGRLRTRPCRRRSVFADQ